MRAPLPRFSLALGLGDVAWALRHLGSTSPGEVARFEEDFAAFVGLRRAFYVPSARLGMYLVLKALDLPAGSPVLMPAWTHPSMPAMVVAAGLTPRIADLERGTWTMGPAQIPEEAWKGVRALVITHMYGCPAPAASLAAEARSRGVVVLEDTAQGLGAVAEGRHAGSTGAASFYSFALTKNFTTLGAGMIGVQDADLAERLQAALEGAPSLPDRSLLPVLVKTAAVRLATSRAGFAAGVYPALAAGWLAAGRDLLHPLFEETFTVDAPRGVKRPAPLQAALGRRLLGRLPAHNAARLANGRGLLERLQGTPGLGLPALPADGTPVFMSFVVTVAQRRRVARELFRLGVDTSEGYLRPVTRVPVLAGRVEQFGPCPVAEELDAGQLHLPVWPGLTEADLDRLAAAVREALRRTGA